MNELVVTARLTRDPESRNTAGGTSLSRFGIAISDRRQNKEGEWEDNPTFLDCTAFGKTADYASEKLSKGDFVLLRGSLKTDRWQAQGGEARSKIVLNVNAIERLPKDAGKLRAMADGDEATSRPATRNGKAKTEAEPEPAGVGAGDAGDDSPIPF